MQDRAVALQLVNIMQIDARSADGSSWLAQHCSSLEHLFTCKTKSRRPAAVRLWAAPRAPLPCSRRQMAVSGSGCRDCALLKAASCCSSSSPASAAHIKKVRSADALVH